LKWLPSLNVIRTFLYDPPPEMRLLLQQVHMFTAIPHPAGAGSVDLSRSA